VSSTQDRVIAAMSAASRLIDDVPPLRLSPGPRSRLPRRGQRSGLGRTLRWGAPLAAAAVIVAVTVVLVMVKNIPDGQVAPRSTATMTTDGVPRYYAALVQGSGTVTTPNRVQIRETLTGKLIGTAKPPGTTTFEGITGAADDLTWVVDAETRPIAGTKGPLGQELRAHNWYRLRLSPGAARPVSLTPLPIPLTGDSVDAIALSPDGSRLAIVTQPPGQGASSLGQLTLRVYSMANGTVLRSWGARSTPESQLVMSGPGALAGNQVLAWTDDGSALAFSVLTEQRAGLIAGTKMYRWNITSAAVRVLPYDTPSGASLLAARPAFALRTPMESPPPNSRLRCDVATTQRLLFTSDGRLICGGTGAVPHPGPPDTCGYPSDWYRIGMLEYSGAYPGSVRVLERYVSSCAVFPDVTPLWTSPSGDAQLGFLRLPENDDPRSLENAPKFGLFRNGRFTQLPSPFAAALFSSYLAW
jgi:hypothetical protein